MAALCRQQGIALVLVLCLASTQAATIVTPTPGKPLQGPKVTTVTPTPLRPGGPVVTQTTTHATPLVPGVGHVTTTKVTQVNGRKLAGAAAVVTPTPMRPLQGPRVTTVTPTPFRPGGPVVATTTTRATPFVPGVGPVTTVRVGQMGRKLAGAKVGIVTPTPFRPMQGPRVTTVTPTPFRPGGPVVTQTNTRYTPFVPGVGPVTTVRVGQIGRKLSQVFVTPTLNPFTGPRVTTVTPTPFNPFVGPIVTSSTTRYTPFNPFVGPVRTTRVGVLGH